MRSPPTWVLGYHGCDREVAEEIFAGRALLGPSKNDYDWLGHGAYFWENSPSRALEFASQATKQPKRTRGKIKTPAVVGAVIDLGECLDLLEASSIRIVSDGYERLVRALQENGLPLPENRLSSTSGEVSLRMLDCAVFEFVHKVREIEGLPKFTSVRAAFVEGNPIYPTAGFNERSHIQICVREPSTIHGYFRVAGFP
ncbi:MAG: hypothetical protein ACOYN0_13515 [Phycisphaerales bacterium]